MTRPQMKKEEKEVSAYEAIEDEEEEKDKEKMSADNAIEEEKRKRSR